MDKDNRIGEWRQASKARADMLDQRLQHFLKPVASEIAHHLDLRLMRTWLQLIRVTFIHRHRNEGGWISALGSYLLPPLQAEAGRKRVTRSAKKRDDRRVFTLIAGYRIRPGVDPTLLRLLLFSALEGHELSDMFFAKHHKIFYDHLAAYIQTRVKDGAFRQVDPLLAARAFIGMVGHHRLLHEIFGVPMDRSHDDTVSTYVDVFLHGLVTAAQTGRARKLSPRT